MITDPETDRLSQVRTACPNAATCLGVQWWAHPETGEVGMVVLHDTTDPQGPALEMSPAEWEVFVQGVKAGKFDLAMLANGEGA